MIKRMLSSNIAWRPTGLTYTTAVIATNGYYVKRDDLISLGRNENLSLLKYLSKEKLLLEFGSGIGKNLFAISSYIKTGYGIDINPFYCRIAMRLAQRYEINNVKFLHYDGETFPELPKFDIIYENGVFERLPKDRVRRYLNLLRNKLLLPEGLMILYFLSGNARNIGFTKRLGDESYVFWEKREIEEIVNKLHPDTIEVQEWPMAYVCILSSVGGAV